MEKAFDMFGREIKEYDVLLVIPGKLVYSDYYVLVISHKYDNTESGHTTGLDTTIPHLHSAWIHNSWTSKRAQIVGDMDSHYKLVCDPENGIK